MLIRRSTVLAYASIAAMASAIACGDDDDNGGGAPDDDAGAGGAAGSGGDGTGGDGTGGDGTGGDGTGGDGTGGDGTGGNGTGGNGTGGNGTGGDAGMDGGTGVTFRGVVVEAIAGSLGNEEGLEGVEVCEVDADGTKDEATCVMSDADGNYAISGLAENTPAILLFEKDGYVTQAVAADVRDADIMRGAPLRMANVADGGQPNFGRDPSVAIESDKGSLNPFAITPSEGDGGGDVGNGFDWTTGVSFEITPSEGDGPFYMDIDEQWVDGATSTQGGWGAWFLNLSPGEYTVTADHLTMDCTPLEGNGWGWAQEDGSHKVPVIAGVNTQAIGFICNPAGDGGTLNGMDAGADASSDASTD